MRGPNYPVKLTEDDRQALETMTRKHTEKQNIVLRAKIILMADAGTPLCDQHGRHLAGASPAIALERGEYVAEGKGARRNSY